MKFIHTADIHLGANPDAGSAFQKERAREIWDSLERLIEVCEEEKTDLLLIAGDLFHRQPLLRELKEVNYLFAKLSATQVVLIAGNHDYLKRESYYYTFKWAENVHMILNSEIDCVEIPVCHTAVYGFSYHTKEVYSKAYVHAYAGHRQKYEILLIHGGDEKHLPIQKEEIKKLGYDYIALGHIHKPQEILPGQMAYPGALEPIDKNDIGTHGYMKGEITEKGCKTVFVPAARREYKHLQVEVSRQMTGYALKEKIKSSIEEQGTQNIYKILLNGYRDPDILFDKTGLDVYGNVIEITDHTRPAYDFEKLYGQNRENILGALIEAFRGCSEESTEYQALCEGVHALMETRRN